MTPAPANDNTHRPAAFDAAILQWMPFLRKMAARMESKVQDREDLINETIAAALQRWASYRDEGSFPGWLVFQMRERCNAMRKKVARRREVAGLRDEVGEYGRTDWASTPARQDMQTEVAQVTGALSGRSGVILLRRAMGDELQEIGRDMGITRQRVQQLEAGERKRLVKALNNVRMAA